MLLAIFNFGAIHEQLNNWKVLPQPERLTELYYTDHTKLPTIYSTQAAQTFGFTAHNLEYRDSRYQYQVTQTNEDGSQVQAIASGQFALRQDASKAIPISFTPGDHGSRSQVTTSLRNLGTNQVQSIHYWVQRVGT